MAGIVKIELISAGVRQLLQGPEIQADLARRAGAIAAAAGASGGEFGHDVRVGHSRARAMVWTEDFAAMEAEAKNRALTRAVDAGRR
jgi:hypothetical protein